MPHQRNRHLESLLEKTLDYSGIVGIFGHRQVGKTTLASKLSAEYVTLDQDFILEQANSDPVQFLQRRSKQKLLVIDECQLAPPLFPALKEWVRTHPKPGQFLLTGSVRFSARKEIRESLTGRIIAWELLPMDLSEATGGPLPDKIPRLLQAKSLEINLEISKKIKPNALEKALTHGGLPGIFAVRDDSIRAQRFESMINTLLERDLKLILQTTLSYSSLRNLLSSLALIQGQPLEWTTLARKSRISVPSLKKLIQAFESMFLIRMIPCEGSEKKSVLFFEDQGEATHLSGNRYDDLTQLVRLLFSQLRHQLHYRPELQGEIFQFRNRGGAHVPLCFRSGHAVLGIIPILTENPHPSTLATARSFLKTYPKGKVLYVHNQSLKDQIIDTQIRALSIQALL